MTSWLGHSTGGGKAHFEPPGLLGGESQLEPRLFSSKSRVTGTQYYSVSSVSSASSVITPPIEPMLAKLTEELPAGDFLYEPKWDGFRAIVFRSESDVFIQSRDSRPLDR